MCGINIILDKKRVCDESAVVRMNTTTFHRGPDNQSYKVFDWGDGILYMGSNRLAIMDSQERSNQPFMAENGSAALVFNGEIYNYKELKNLYLSSSQFATSSDTEVLFKLLQGKGLQALPLLNGMFAFCYVDLIKKKILIARDEAGIKPLYYYNDDNYFLASSEIKGILASGLVKKELLHDQVYSYLKYKHARKPFTFYRGVMELVESHCLELEDGRHNIKNYSSHVMENDDVTYSLDNVVYEVEQLLFQAVQRQLNADTPVGLFLSGGVDSTLLLAMASEAGKKNFPVFTIMPGTNKKSFNTEDAYYATEVAKQFKAEVTAVEVNNIEEELFHSFIEKTDQPIADSAAYLTMLLSEKAANKVKVTLSGAGADEMFAGYNRHRAFHQYLEKLEGKHMLISLMKRSSGILPEGFHHPWRKKFRLYNKLLGGVDNDAFITYENFVSLAFENSLFLNSGSSMPVYPRHDPLQYMLEYDRNEYLISDVFAVTDKYSMLNSLEVRVPYLDKDLVDYVKKLSVNDLLKNGPKWILKSILQKRVEARYTQRAKEGFGLPVGAWFGKKEGRILKDFVLEKDNLLYELIPYEKAKGMVNLHLAKKRDYGSELWSLAVLAAWLKREFQQ